MNIRIIEYRPPKIAQLLLLLAAAVHWLLPVVDIKIYGNLMLAVISAITGFGIMMAAWWQFKQAGTAICPTGTESSLITTGVFRLTRNPMYLGMILMLLAVSLWMGSLAFYLVTVMYFLVIHLAFCPFEEKKLDTAFGETYRLYKFTVRRWF